MIFLYISSFTYFFGTEPPPSSLHEYCMWDTFTAYCSSTANEVVHVTAARYGRMRLGRCLQTAYEIGCSADVLDVVQGRCNGRHSCAILIPDRELHRIQPCPRDLAVYLEIDYHCVPGRYAWLTTLRLRQTQLNLLATLALYLTNIFPFLLRSLHRLNPAIITFVLFAVSVPSLTFAFVTFIVHFEHDYCNSHYYWLPKDKKLLSMLQNSDTLLLISWLA